jgi:ethanolamine ammonia-lyase small subunit
LAKDLERVWAVLHRATPARIGLGRSGNATPTFAELEFRSAHAAARDAVHADADLPRLLSAVAALGLGVPHVVPSQARNRAECLRRADLGRIPMSLESISHEDADVALVFADGLSPQALNTHGVPLAAELSQCLSTRFRLARPVIATQARMAIGDWIGQALGVSAALVLIGERPGLSVAQSIGIYLTFDPQPGRTDAERNCISNVHPPDGLSYKAAAKLAMELLQQAYQLGESGVRLKNRAGLEVEGTESPDEHGDGQRGRIVNSQPAPPAGHTANTS